MCCSIIVSCNKAFQSLQTITCAQGLKKNQKDLTGFGQIHISEVKMSNKCPRNNPYSLQKLNLKRKSISCEATLSIRGIKGTTK